MPVSKPKNPQHNKKFGGVRHMSLRKERQEKLGVQTPFNRANETYAQYKYRMFGN